MLRKKSETNDLFHELLKSGQLSMVGRGLLSRSGEFLAIMRRIEGSFRSSALRRGAIEEEYPAMISVKDLSELGFFSSFPELTNVVLHVDRNKLPLQIRRNAIDRESLDPHDADLCLTPAVCYHTYVKLKGSTLPQTPVLYITKGRVFRYEGKRLTNSPERLREFSMQEAVFFGNREYVRDTRKSLMRTVQSLARSLGIEAEIVEANDPFFTSDDNHGKMMIQKLLQTKLELVVPLEKGRKLAIASFNDHGTFFTERMDIGDGLTSGCVALGLERFAYAYFLQHGTGKKRK